jgi:hypothetical protein
MLVSRSDQKTRTKQTARTSNRDAMRRVLIPAAMAFENYVNLFT